MYPAPTYAWDDRAALRAFVQAHSFGLLAPAAAGIPQVTHLPVVWLDDAQLGFHLARSNPQAKDLDGAAATFTVLGAHGYVSPDWYGLDEQVPTWNYVSVTLGGVARRLTLAETMDQLDRLAAAEEMRLRPKEPWTRDKIRPGLAERMASGLVGYALHVTSWRGMRKLGQDMSDAARHAAADGLERAGKSALAASMRTAVRS